MSLDGLRLERVKQPTPQIRARWAKKDAWLRTLQTLRTSTLSVMTKTLEVITEAIQDTKHPFRKADQQPRKAQKHRYERRKIREYLHLTELVDGEAPEPA